MRLFGWGNKAYRETEKALGYRFRNPDLLEVALTHRSHAYEQGGDRETSYERLEFLGDAVLGFIVAEWLFRSDSSAEEGTLSRRRQSIVNTNTLAEVARDIGLGKALRLGRGEDRTGGRSKRSVLADTFEAVLGAVYLDGGHRPAKALVLRHLQRRLEDSLGRKSSRGDHKTLLQERAQASLRVTPRYRIVSRTGPPHACVFEVEVLLDDRVTGTGTGSNRKRAEQMAARMALETLSQPEPER